MLELLSTLPAAVLMLWLGSIEWRMRTMNSRLSEGMKATDIKEMIDLKQEALKQQQQDLKEDIHRLESKIDKLIDLSSKY